MTYRDRDHGKGPYEDEYRGFDIRDDETSRGPLILTLAIGVLIIFAAVVWNTYRQGVRPQDGALPMVVAESQPYKRVPDDRGGVEIDDLDRRLYDVIDGSERQPAQAAQQTRQSLDGAPPMDLRPSSPTEEDGAPDSAEADESTSETATDEQSGSGMQISVDPGPDAADTENVGDAETQSVAPTTTEPETEETAAASEPAPAPAVETPATLSGEAEGFAYSQGGEFYVQISALRSEAAAADAWQKVKSANPDLFSGADMSIERADLGAKGVFYRLRAGAFGSRDSASEFCDAYKQQGGDCIVVRETA